MKKIALLIIALFSVGLLSACTGETLSCGEGTVLVDGVCQLITTTEDQSATTTTSMVTENTTVNVVSDPVCLNETGLHTVKGASPTTISEWLNWTFIGGHLVTDPDNAWIIDYGAAVFNVHTVSQRAWEGSFTQSGMFLTEGCEYTFEFTIRTDVTSIKPDVIVFGQNMSGVSFFEETVDLEIMANTYSFTVIPETSDYVATGVYFANSVGMVVIEEIQIYRHPIGTNS